MSTRSRVPEVGLDPAHYQFLDDLDKRRLAPVSAASGTDVGEPEPSGVAEVDDSAITTVDTTAATDATPFGFTQTQADAIPVAINELISRVDALVTAVNALAALPLSADASDAVNGTRAQLNELIAEMKNRGAMEN